MTETRFQIRVLSSIGEIDAGRWDRLARVPRGSGGGLEDNPFLRHAFLSALEESRSAVADTGWLPRHLVLETETGEALTALPCYLKNHSQGEYVFDHGWAEAYYRAGGEYYTKLQSSVPFTPASGPRFLTGAASDRALLQTALSEGLKQLTRRHGASSAHITFMREAEWRRAEASDMLLRTDRQFHWLNQDYRDFNDFLENLASRKRKNIRKERQAARSVPGLEIRHLTGTDLSEAVLDDFFRFYIDTGSRKWGQPYLTREFFSLIAERMAEKVLLVMARRDGRHIAGAINFIGDDCLYGRHWGCMEHHPFLHFEICYYQAIDYAIAQRLSRVEAGAQGEHKLARGYLPVTTYSAHHIEHEGLRRAIADYLAGERRHVSLEAEYLGQHAPFRKS